ncbi:MAG: DPP IV N-terminal domain-containing protein [Thermomonas sp.]
MSWAVAIAKRVGLGLVMGAMAVIAHAQGIDESLRERLQRSDQYFRFYTEVCDSRPPVHWVGPDSLVYWDECGENAGTWVLAEPASNRSRPVLPAVVLLNRIANGSVPKPDRLHNMPYVLSPDKTSLVFAYAGRTFSLAVATGELKEVNSASTEGWPWLEGAQIAPDGAKIAIADADGLKIRSRDGVLFKTAGERDYTWELPPNAWSADGRQVVVMRTDVRKVHHIPVVDYLGALESVEMVPYAKVGSPIAKTEAYVFDVTTRRLQRVGLGAIPDSMQQGAYLWFAGWRPDGKQAFLLRLSRNAKRLQLLAFDPRTAEAHALLTEKNDRTFVAGLDFAVDGWSKQFLPLDASAGFLWMSERDGWRHVYAYGYDGQLKHQVTQGEFPVQEVIGVDPRRDLVYVLSSSDPAAPYATQVDVVPLSGGSLTRVSKSSGQHRASLSPSGQFLLDEWSNLQQPRVRDVLDLRGGRNMRLTVADAGALLPLHRRPPEAFSSLAADGKTRLYGVLYLPVDFQPELKYPVVDIIYAGPFTTAVPQGFIGTDESLRAESLAQLGFVTIVVDARGTPGRGKAFQDANYGRLGQTEIPDHVAVITQAATTRPYMDLDRVGIWGHSWGGYFAIRAMLTAPKMFKAGYAGAPGAFTEEAIIMEPYMDTREANPEGYAMASNEKLASNLQGSLKLMHGTSDTNATFSTTMRMADALIRSGKHFDMLVMPGQPHSLQGAMDDYYWDDVRLFFLEKLGARRSDASGEKFSAKAEN